MLARFYAYLYLREDGTPYYVGKGTGDRAFHKAHSVRLPKDRSHILIMPCSNEDEAFSKEKELIVNWGRKDNGTGILRNMSDGGEGRANPSEEVRRRISDALRGNTHGLGYRFSEEQRRNLSNIHKGKQPCLGNKLSEEHKSNISKSLLGVTRSEATRRKISEARKAYWKSKKETLISMVL
jgi:hypothetical protein